MAPNQFDGMGELIKRRKETGSAPRFPVWLWIGFPKSAHRGKSVELVAEKVTRMTDVRGLFRLDVMVCARAMSPQLLDFYGRVCEIANSATLWCEEYGSDLDSMLIYSRRTGETKPIGDM